MVESSGSEENAAPSPVGSLREQMRRRRPHLFSDTIRSSEPQITREVLDYHLETLTKRKQEYQFEHFARALAEKELCPNLRTQTGPTGGGDAKVDSETYAVAPDIAERPLLSQRGADGSSRWWRTDSRSNPKRVFSTASRRPSPHGTEAVEDLSGRRIAFGKSRWAFDQGQALGDRVLR